MKTYLVPFKIEGVGRIKADSLEQAIRESDYCNITDLIDSADDNGDLDMPDIDPEDIEELDDGSNLV